MPTYVIFDLDGCVAFFDRATDKTEAIHKLTKQDESYADIGDLRVHKLDSEETALMRQWIDGGQKTHEWPFDWHAIQ